MGLFAMLFILFLRPIDADGDFYHHMNLGRLVLERWSFPSRDEFTFTARGDEFVGYAWGSGVLFSLLYRNVGPAGIGVLVALVATLTIFLLALLIRGAGVSWKTTFLLSWVSAALVATRWPARPEIWTYPFLVLFLLIGQKWNRHPKLLGLFPVVTLLWANLYGASFPIGLLVLGGIAVKQLLKDRWRLPKKHAMFYCAITSCLPVALLNGYGAASIFFIQNIPAMSEIHGDWASIPTLLQHAPLEYLLTAQYRVLLYLLYLAVAAAMTLIALRSHIRKTMGALAAGWITATVPIFAARHIPLGVILSIPFVASCFSVLSKKTQRVFSVILAGFGIFGTFLILWISPPGVGEDTDAFPPRLIAFIREHHLSGRALNTQRIGAFLTYHLYPSVTVFSDTRDELFLKAGPITDLQATLTGGKSLTLLLEKYDIDLVVADLSESRGYQELFYSAAWTPVFITGRYVLFVPSSVARNRGLPLLDVIDPFSESSAKDGREDRAIQQYTNALDFQNIEFNEGMRLARTLRAQSRFKDAISLLQKLSVGYGPLRTLQILDRETLLAETFIMNGTCDLAKLPLKDADNARKRKLIFRPGAMLPSDADRVFALFYTACEPNPTFARQFLERYVSESGASPLEKLKFIKKLNAL